MKEKKLVDGVVVIYNPENCVLENIATYVGFLNQLYVVDNSDKSNDFFIQKLKDTYPNIKYVAFNENLGIAKALNEGIKNFLLSKSKWLLTMDQDSKFDERDLKKFIEKIAEESIEKDMIGILSPTHITRDKAPQSKEDKYVERVMTSGNLVSKQAIKIIGNFDEALFIDEVDHDYCFRMKRAGFKIKVLADIFLSHNLGNINKQTKLPKILIPTNHNAIRRYYITRNKLYMMKRYPEIRTRYTLTFINDLFKILIFENNKKEKLKMIARGCLDYKKNILGKYKG